MSNRPAARTVSAWIKSLTPDCDAPILRARDLIAALRSPYATADQAARARAVARECLFLAVQDLRSETGSRHGDRLAADTRLDRALTTAVDHTGAFREGFKECVRQIRATCDECRAAHHAAAAPDELAPARASLADPLMCAHARELRVMFARNEAARG